jgi:LPS-assembly lipoprotein
MSSSSRSLIKIVVLGATLLLGACGFHPLHGKDGGKADTVPEMSAIKIGLITDRTGQILRNELLDLLTPKGQPERPVYQLNVTISESKSGLGILKDEMASRANYSLNSSFNLVDYKTGKTLYSSQASSQASFNILSEHYASTSSEQNARERTAKEVAENISMQISAFFSRSKAAQGSKK